MVIEISEDVKNKILVVSSFPNSRELISEIIGKDTFRSLYSDEIHSIDWIIDTKYYTADVDFWHLSQHQYPPALPISVDQLGDLCEALILVFDSSNYESFEQLHNWAKFVEEFAPSVSLCVGVGKCENTRIFNEWCIDNGLEFVVVDKDAAATAENGEPATQSTTTQSEATTDNAQEQGDEDEDEDYEEDRFSKETEGRERIIEALGSTMWTNMKQKARRIETQLNMLSLGNDSETDLEIPRGERALPTFDPLNFEEDLRFARGEFQHATEEITQNLRALQTFLRETELAEENEDGEGPDRVPGFGSNNIENNVEKFESALTGMRRLRENAQQLPDAQRKALAAHVVSMLFPDEDWQ